MTHFSDPIRTGSTFSSTRPAPGAPTSPVYVYTGTPVTGTTTGLGALQTLSGAPFTATIAAGNGVTSITFANMTLLDLGMSRCPTVVTPTGSVGEVAFTIIGYDAAILPDNTYTVGQLVTQTFSGPAITGTTTGLKAIRYVKSIAGSGNTLSTVSFGVSDTVGFPVKVGKAEDVILKYNNQTATGLGLTVAVTTNPSTAALGDVRGTYALQSAADNSKVFCAWIFVRDPNLDTGVWGVPQV